MTRKSTSYLIGTIALLVFAGFTLASFQSSLSQYVSFDQARQMTRTVQVAGGLQPNSYSYSHEDEALLFTLVDQESGALLPVRYHGLKPANFEEAISIVAIGRFDEGRNEFAADKLLVKCPSKYQGAEVEEKSYA